VLGMAIVNLVAGPAQGMNRPTPPSSTRRASRRVHGARAARSTTTEFLLNTIPTSGVASAFAKGEILLQVLAVLRAVRARAASPSAAANSVVCYQFIEKDRPTCSSRSSAWIMVARGGGGGVGGWGGGGGGGRGAAPAPFGAEWHSTNRQGYGVGTLPDARKLSGHVSI
jgi:hypothetical protein